MPKTRGFQPKLEGWNLYYFFCKVHSGVTPLYGLCRHVALTGTVITCVTTRNDLTLMKLETGTCGMIVLSRTKILQNPVQDPA